MLRYTGHPLVDVGAATILAFCRKRTLSELTEVDLDKVADFVSEHYVVNPLKSFLTVAFPNSGFTQPAFDKQPERRQDYARRVTRGYAADAPLLDEQCVFTGEPAVAVAFSDKDDYPLGRAFRQHIPMTLGEEVINFYPGGDTGLPISGKAMLCIQTFPLGCAKCGGRLLAIHSDNPEITELFAARFLVHNRRAVSLAQAAGESKLPEANASAKTLLIETLLQADEERYQARREERPASLTAYHLSNSGQSNALDARNPPLEIHHLPLEIMGFLWAIHKPGYKADWEKVAHRAWRLARAKKGRKTDEPTEDTRPRHNFLYEDLFDLPLGAAQFVRRYFLRLPARRAREDDPRRGYSLKNETDLVSWKLTELFLGKVVNMDKDRIQQIRELGDRLAAYVAAQNDRGFFRSFLQHRYDYFRMALLKANLSHVRRGNPPLITLDPYIDVFEDGEELARSDWRLARDLVMIRMVEQLYQQGWLGQNPDAVPEVTEEPQAAA